MDIIDASLPEFSRLVERRVELLRDLADSLESSSLLLARNDAEGIAHGASHQAELCRQWSVLEEELRRRAGQRSALTDAPANFGETEHLARLQAEWETIGQRIRYLARVHWSLLRHLNRSLAVLNRIVGGCSSMYAPDPDLLRRELHRDVGLGTGGRACRG